MGVAFLASGLIRLTTLGTTDLDTFVGVVFLVAGLVMRVARK